MPAGNPVEEEGGGGLYVCGGGGGGGGAVRMAGGYISSQGPARCGGHSSSMPSKIDEFLML